MKTKTFVIYILFVVSFFIVKSYEMVFKDVFYRRLLEADGKVIVGRPLRQYRGISPAQCGVKCLNHYLCSSFFINKEIRHCKLAGEVSLKEMVSLPGYRYYVSQDCKRSVLGWEYKGTRDRTVSGTLCQRWDKQYPHKHDYHSFSSEQNYCRNPAKAYAKGPWCYTTDAEPGWNYCFVPKCVTKPRECRTTKTGENYFGTVNKTASGIECQRWGDHFPRNHSYTILKAEGNYCRNPFGEKAAPWCYTVQGRNEYELCDIPEC